MDDETLRSVTELLRSIMQYKLNVMVYEAIYMFVCPAGIVGFLTALRIATFFRKGG
jgi:hypothetical protein